MAVYILLLKEYEDNETVVYKLGPHENTMGKMKLNKIIRKFSELEEIPDKDLPSTFYFDLAVQRLAVCLEREEVVFPEKTAFES
ncbi:hypothetical protein ABES74_11275 [Bacillus subtilis]|uniref:hypothetical protein n=1 Tax=Bacillus TaxID=1386 RepID=UPI0013D82A2A|nr:hypothetical protein [Bacillus subtilis]MDK1001435.1 hypothetical protein [Bacillus subtilis]MEC2133740.1 hypothetical protein [Bacillus subtilis]NRF45326.1 hypothetical protein [Bacillus subtilis]